MIFRRKKPAPPARCPEVPDRLTRHEVESILAGPNGRNMLREMRTAQTDLGKTFADNAASAEQHVRFCRAMQANCEAAVREIDRALREVQA